MGYKSGSVASTRFGQVRKQMESSFDGPTSAGSDTAAVTPPKAPKTKANKVTKSPAKPRTPHKGVAQHAKKVVAQSIKKSAQTVKKEDSEMDDDIVDHDDEVAPAQEHVFA